MATKHKHRKPGDWVSVHNGRNTKERNNKRGLRDSAKCVWGCGRMIPTGGGALLSHLAYCHGSPRHAH